MTALLGTALLAGAAGGGAYAQGLFGQEGETLYSGRPAAQSGITLGSWGSGLCTETTLGAYSGSYTLRITPKDLYAGGRIDFTNPVDLTKSFKDPDAYLQVVTRFGEVRETYDPWAVGLAAPGATDVYGGTATPGKQVKRVRVAIQLDGGQVLEIQLDVAWFELKEDGWINLSIPLAVLKGKLDLPAYKVKRLVIAGNGTDPFYVGEIRTLRDTAPLQADAGGDKEVAKNYHIVFHGFSEAGASAVKYTWDFNHADGIQEEAVGDLIYHRFSRAGNYIATLTVSDVFGLKKPAISTINVKVNE